MTPIRTRDKIFCAVALPIVAAVSYAWLWRSDSTRRLDALRGEVAGLVAAEDYPFAKKHAERLLAEAKAERETERKTPPGACRVKGDAAASEAARDLAVQQIFLQAGLRITGSAPTEGPMPRAGEVLKASGVRPTPRCRTYALEGRYPKMLAALTTLAESEMAAIPVSLSLSGDHADRWEVVLCL